MSETDIEHEAGSAPRPTVRRADEIEYEDNPVAIGLAKGVLIGEAQGAPNFKLRRFTLDPGAEVPRHTNEIEHEQYVLEGEYTVGIEEDGKEREYTVTPGDSLLIPAGVVHWYRNEGDEPGAFLCAVPNGDDEILLEGAC